MEIKAKEITLFPTIKLSEYPKNANVHTEEQIDKIIQLIDFYGHRDPLIVDADIQPDGTHWVLAGNGRLQASKKAGWDNLPIIFQKFNSEEEKYGFMVSHNAVSSSGWGGGLDLAKINTDIIDLGPDFDIDMLAIKDFVIEPIEKFEPQSDEDEVPEVVHPITRRGDLWILGNHRLYCGDSTMIDDVEKLMNGEKAEMLFTDPPYNQNVGLTGDIDNKGMKKRQELLKQSNLNDFNPTEFLAIVSALDIDSIYIFHSKDLIADYITYLNSIKRNWELLAMTKPSVIPFRKGHFLSDIEWLIFSKKSGSYFDESLDNSFYSKFRSAKTVRDKDNWHPTRKDVEYVSAYIQISAKNTVLDLFMGSGTTLIACEKTNRQCYGMELDEKYCDVIINRWQNYTGKKATLELSGQTYEELKQERENV